MPVYISLLHKRPEYNNKLTAYMIADMFFELENMLGVLKIDSGNKYRIETITGTKVVVLSKDERREAFCYHQARLCSEQEFLKRLVYIKRLKH